MRQIINISLPPQLAKLVNDSVSSGQYATKSEFFRSLLRRWSNDQLSSELEQSYRDMKKGKKYLLRSLKDLR